MRPILLLAVLLSTTTAGAQSPELDAIASVYPANEPGAAVIVVKDGDVLLRKGYGMANLELDVPIEPDMIFRIGSVTKQFTAAAILLLQERGELSVRDDIRKYLPDYPTEGKTIEIEHLLNHTSGIRSYTDMESFGDYVRDDLTVEELIATFENERLAFEPGSKWAYNNSGYFLLGAIIEKVTGQTYEDFLQKNIFDPLGMSHTFYGSPSRIIRRRASGYDQEGDAFVNASYLSMRLPYAAGSLLSSVDDLAKWDAALYGTSLLSQASLDAWWKPFRLTNGDTVSYGYGWRLSSYAGHFVAEHGGGINGFTCHVLRMPDERLYVAVLTNRAAEAPGPGTVARELAAAAIGRPIQAPVATPVAESVLADYEGVYRPNERARYIVRLTDGKLNLRRWGDEHPGGGRVRDPGPAEGLNRRAAELVPTSATTFTVEDGMLDVRFEHGGLTLVVENWGNVERAERTDESFEDQALVLKAVDVLFDGMRAVDTDLMRSVLDPDARLVSTKATPNGLPMTTTLSVEDFVARISGHTGPVLDERTGTPHVEVADDLATLWVPYTFFVGDTLSHCGEDAFQLTRSAAGWPGWKIIAIADTRRTTGCEVTPP